MVHRGPPLKILRTLAYRRVSTAEPEKGRTSLNAQTEAIAAYCLAHGLPRAPSPLALDAPASGGEESEHTRGEVHRRLANIRAAARVIVPDVDPFSRDIVFTVQRVGELLRKDAVCVSMEQRFDFHTPNAETTLRQGDRNAA